MIRVYRKCSGRVAQRSTFRKKRLRQLLADIYVLKATLVFLLAPGSKSVFRATSFAERVKEEAEENGSDGRGRRNWPLRGVKGGGEGEVGEYDRMAGRSGVECKKGDR